MKVDKIECPNCGNRIDVEHNIISDEIICDTCSMTIFVSVKCEVE